MIVSSDSVCHDKGRIAVTDTHTAHTVYNTPYTTHTVYSIQHITHTAYNTHSIQHTPAVEGIGSTVTRRGRDGADRAILNPP